MTSQQLKSSKSSGKYKAVNGAEDKKAGGIFSNGDSSDMALTTAAVTSTAGRSPILTADQAAELGGYDFTFENIVFEGGGNKGLSATGAIRVLEELGYWSKITRFAGASAGAMITALVCVGYNSHDIEEFLCGDIGKVFLDARFGVLSFLPNMLLHYGCHPGEKINRWFGEKVKSKMGNADLTFEELYSKTKRELCITVTNMNSMDCTYCHVKTTPDMPIRKAVRMSACIPGVFCPVQVTHPVNKTHDYFVDGGMLCNYPIHCFDGWYLSMEHQDSFLKKVQRLAELPKLWDPRERFGKRNDKTIGILLYSAGEKEVMKDVLKERFKDRIIESERIPHPETKLANQRADKIRKLESAAKEHGELVASMSRFMQVLDECDIDESGTISVDEFNTAMHKKPSKFTDEDKTRLFGEDFRDTEALFKRLDTSSDNQISFKELLSFADKKGLSIMEHFRGYQRQEITSLRSYFGTLMETLLLNMKRIFIQAGDVDRTIGIDTGYLDTLDFKMEKPDQIYLVEQGKLGCIAYLRELIDGNSMVRK
ncbi:uncharacterized protein LOC117291448 [Asterias rubens]|uniref:uncharacterized protein LOC117291448 n=1 Tax=Asterias rubens TaxID=7604 RepID=UPI001454F44A|nr:uncharacterized protein LOC117291448 [Asterias rubens]